MNAMKPLASLAFQNGLVAGANVIVAVYNVFGAVFAAAQGDVMVALVSYAVAAGSGMLAWRAWQKHRRGLANLGGA